MDIKIIELNINIKLKKDIKLFDLPEQLSKGINFYFLNNERLKNLHEKNTIKLYSYSHLLPIETDKLYKKGKFYSFKMRFMNMSLINDFYESLNVIENPIFKIYSKNFDVINFDDKIEYIENITPSVITLEKNKCLDRNHSNKELIKDRIIKNSLEKLSVLSGEKIEYYDFVDDIEIINNHSIIHCYKGGIILGNKYKLKLKQDKKSQLIAKVILGSGLLEKNGLSFGFCNKAGEM